MRAGGGELVGVVRGADPDDVPHADMVRRSLLTLLLMTHEETGGIVAAPTTSLPEDFGGERNWDYRFCWLRDAALTLESLLGAGYEDEAFHWRQWLLRAVAAAMARGEIDPATFRLRFLGRIGVPGVNLPAVARELGLGEVVAMGGNLRLAPIDLPDSLQVRMQRLYPGSRLFNQTRSLSVPLPAATHGVPVSDGELIAWTEALLTALTPAQPATAPA